ncbi:hypothetical protein N9P60_00170 [bacterium]|nr:hypothetical protein [bacterium]MDB4319842.1 hypothetical protein [bacterium]
MANIPIWPGTSTFTPGSTPFGFYDADADFILDADKVAKFCSQRLGYPIVDIELQDIQFYTAFEEAVTTYGNELYAYKIRQDYLSLEGASSTTNLNTAIVTPNLANVIKISEQYGTETGTGGNTDWHTGSLALTASVQTYDLGKWAEDNLGVSGSDFEIKRVFYEAPPAIIKYFDPYAGSGTGAMNMMDSFGWGEYSPAVNFMLMPMNFDIQKLQAIELNDQIRKSNYSFEIQNNKLRLFPIPKNDLNELHFQYLLKSERLANSITPTTDTITNVSNVPYANPTYAQVNSVGRSWIFEYALALSKEMLGYVRGKYSTIPIPGDSVTVNSADLISAAANERTALIERLRAYFDETSKEKLMERRSLETDYLKKELTEVPNVIYIG